ncbi:tryptophan-rich sensory protein [Moorella thermoacetica Y72]|uniref:Tryptophan-rich sensory protein n=1 Tax=Moorella thermoacetica Y72 TaxID=1325331 RepID=A0A0S6U6W5_NEOTH|nr:tryptophan-rich sensory protein [Moorella thermoacetica Y72]
MNSHTITLQLQADKPGPALEKEGLSPPGRLYFPGTARGGFGQTAYCRMYTP